MLRVGQRLALVKPSCISTRRFAPSLLSLESNAPVCLYHTPPLSYLSRICRLSLVKATIHEPAGRAARSSKKLYTYGGRSRTPAPPEIRSRSNTPARRPATALRPLPRARPSQPVSSQHSQTQGHQPRSAYEAELEGLTLAILKTRTIYHGTNRGNEKSILDDGFSWERAVIYRWGCIPNFAEQQRFAATLRPEELYARFFLYDSWSEDTKARVTAWKTDRPREILEKIKSPQWLDMMLSQWNDRCRHHFILTFRTDRDKREVCMRVLLPPDFRYNTMEPDRDTPNSIRTPFQVDIPPKHVLSRSNRGDLPRGGEAL